MVTITQPSRRDRKKHATRERIIGAGAAAFARRGLDGATIDEIALAADVGKGTVYNYFRTKEDIFVAFLIQIEQEAQREVLRLTAGRGSLETILTRFIQRQFELKKPHYPFVRLFLAQLAGRATSESEWVHEAQKAMDPPLHALFGALQKRGLIRGDLDRDAFTGTFKVMQLGLMMLWAIEGPPWPGIDEAVRAQVRCFCSGIEARS